MLLHFQSSSPLVDLRRHRLTHEIVDGLRKFASIGHVVVEEHASIDDHRRDSACVVLARRNRHHNLIDDNPSSG